MRIQFELMHKIMTEQPESLDEIEIMIGDFYSIFGYLRHTCDIDHHQTKIRQHERPYWVGDCDIPNGANFLTSDELVNAPVYAGRSLRDVWEQVVIICAAGRDPDDWIRSCNIEGSYFDVKRDAWCIG